MSGSSTAKSARERTFAEIAETLESELAWAGFSTVIFSRLTEAERAALAHAALISLGPDQAEAVAALAIGAAGAPPPAFTGGMSDARSWSSWASRSELKAFALATYEAMSAQDQAAFVRHVTAPEIAA